MSENLSRDLMIAGGAATLNPCYFGLNLQGAIAASVTFATVFLAANVESVNLSNPEISRWEKVKIISKDIFIILSNIFLQVKLGSYLGAMVPKITAIGCIFLGSLAIYFILRSKENDNDSFFTDCTLLSGIAAIAAGVGIATLQMFKPI